MFKSIRVGRPRSPVTVLGVFEGTADVPPGLSVPAAVRRALKDALATPGFRGDAGEVAPGGAAALVLGLGPEATIDARALRTAGGRLARRLDRIAPRGATLLLPRRDLSPALDARRAGRCLGEALGLANWRVDFFDGAATKRQKANPALTITAADAGVREGLRRGLLLAECANEARRVAATPPNICNPPWIAKEARRLARRSGLGCRVIGYAEAQRLGMGGLAAVGRGSASKPCMVVLEHRPARPRKGVRLVLVGKTMTYDTGGYSLKVANGMKGMKYDGNGGCAVLGAMLAIAALDLPVHVFGLLPSAENMVGGDSYRPDDIITMYNGVTVEVTNTDAEGRLVLGDALAWACRRLKPTAILDAATLTGGVVVALGPWCAGLFCNDDELRGRIESAAETTGERVWRLPLWSEHRDFMRAKHADVWNSGPKRDGHPLQGAAFLSYFVEEGVPWAHLDIAGVSAVETDDELFVTGPTGYGVRLLTEVVASYAQRASRRDPRRARSR